MENRNARTLMKKVMIPPETGKNENNRNWSQIDPQLVNEIWSLLYFDMTSKATERAAWGARITNDIWRIYLTIAYAVMYHPAFFEQAIEKLVTIALEAIPINRPFREGMSNIIRWYRVNNDCRVISELIHKIYYRYLTSDYEAPVFGVSSLCNWRTGIMVVLFEGGDFVK